MSTVVAQVASQLGLEGGDKVHDADAVAEQAGHQRRRLPERDDRDVDQRAHLLVDGVGGGRDQERVVTVVLRAQCRPTNCSLCSPAR